MFFKSFNSQLIAVSGLVAAASAFDSPYAFSERTANDTSSPAATCDFFKQNYPNMTLVPTDSGYAAENEVSWNAGAWLGPACVLVPATAEQMSCAVKNLVKFATPFAMRGGGHMPIPDAANINSTGILISSTNLKTMELSEDKETLSVGPGHRWGDVYIYLNSTQSGKMVVGGRYAPVGIPGYLLGGGMSFFSYEYGFSSTNGNVRAYNVVLANGTIASVTADNSYSDLYWALQGGGNSFALVTSFDLKTFDSPSVMLANPSYGFGETTKDAYLNSVLNYCVNGSSDPKAAIIPVARLAANFSGPRYDATLFYNGNDSAPAVLSDFQGSALPGSSLTNLTSLTMADFSVAVSPAFKSGGESFGLQQRFHVMSTLATRQAMDIVHDTYFNAVLSMGLTNLTDFFTGLAWNSITTEFIKQSNTGEGCPQGIIEQPLFWVEESLTWGDSADDAIIENFSQVVNANITAQLAAANLTTPYIYLNDAD